MFPKWKRSWEVVLSMPNPLPASLSHATQTTSQLRERKDQLEGVRRAATGPERLTAPRPPVLDAPGVSLTL